MKWYCALNVSALPRYEKMLRVAAKTASQHTDLRTNLLFDGPACTLTDDFLRAGATVHFTSSSLAPELEQRARADGYRPGVARGSYLRLEIPRIEQGEEFILYTDVDVMFHADADWNRMQPRLFAAAAEYNTSWPQIEQSPTIFNSGVMIMNVPECRRRFEPLKSFIRDRGYYFHGNGGFYDQGALNAYFPGEFEELPNALNYRIFSNERIDPVITHFHGPKPQDVRDYIAGGAGVSPLIRDLYARNPAGYTRMLELFDATLLSLTPGSHGFVPDSCHSGSSPLCSPSRLSRPCDLR